MKTHIIIYNEFAQFEVVLATYFLGTKTDIVTVGLTDKTITSSEGFKTTPHITISELNPKEIDTLIIPGGDQDNLKSNHLIDIIRYLHSNNKTIGAICSGTIQLAKAGILNRKKYTTVFDISEEDLFPEDTFINDNVVIDGNLITAKGNAYVDFALILAKTCNIFEDNQDFLETVRYFKEFKSN